MDSKGSILNNANGISIALLVNDSSEVINLPLTSISIISGQGSTNNKFNFEKRGVFNISGSGTNLNPSSLQIVQIMNNVSKIMIEANPQYVSIHTMTNISIKVLGLSENPFLDECVLLLKDNLLNTIVNQTTKKGVMNVPYYYNSTEVSNLKAWCEDKEESLNITVYPLHLEMSLSITVRLT